MIENLVMLASYGAFGGGSIGNVLAQWEAAGIFSYALPFLLMFALIFAILGFVPIFKDNKGINAAISLAVSLMALQFDMVPLFFSEIFPRLGVGLAVVLVLMILLGLFVKDKEVGNKIMRWILAIGVLVIAIVVISKSFGAFGFGNSFGYWFRSNGATMVGIVIFVAILIAIIVGKPSKPAKVPGINISGLGAD